MIDLTFTEYILSIEDFADLPSEGFDEVWKKLRIVLRRNMIQRDLWGTSPRYLGVDGFQSWYNKEAFDELCHACAERALFSMIPALRALAREGTGIDGAVVTNIKNFITSRQRKHDPIGYRVYDFTKRAVQNAVQNQILFILSDGPPRVANRTLLSTAPDRDPDAAGEVDLSEQIAAWDCKLLTDFVLARLRTVESQLMPLMTKLTVEVFCFKDLIDPLKKRVREHWWSTWCQDQDTATVKDGVEDGARIVRICQPDSQRENRVAHASLRACMKDAVACDKALRDVWDSLQELFANDEIERMPSQSRLAEHLNMSRNTLRKYLQKLRDLVEACEAGTDKTKGDAV